MKYLVNLTVCGWALLPALAAVLSSQALTECRAVLTPVNRTELDHIVEAKSTSWQKTSHYSVNMFSTRSNYLSIFKSNSLDTGSYLNILAIVKRLGKNQHPNLDTPSHLCFFKNLMVLHTRM